MAHRPITHSASSESLASDASAASTNSISKPVAQPTDSQRPRQFVLRHEMTPNPDDKYIFWHLCCQCETRLVINAWCMDCQHHRCAKCHL